MLTISRSLCLVAAVAVALGSLLPAPHAHLNLAGAIVHLHDMADSDASHVSGDADHDHATFDHGDHRAAQIRVPPYDIAARFVLIITTEIVAMPIDGPDVAGVRQPTRTALLPTHDPPLRFTSSPAPPSAV